MIRIYHSQGTRGLRVIWLCEEMGLDYEVVACTFGQWSPEFLAVNPAATLPAMTDGDVSITESVAMLIYIAETYGPTPLVVKPGAANYGDYLQFLIFGEAGLAAPLNAVVGTNFFAPEEQKKNFTYNLVLEGFHRRMKLIERQLEKHPYIAGDAFTLADISCGYTLGLAEFVGQADKIAPHVMEWRARLQERPAFQRAAAK